MPKTQMSVYQTFKKQSYKRICCYFSIILKYQKLRKVFLPFYIEFFDFRIQGFVIHM